MKLILISIISYFALIHSIDSQIIYFDENTNSIDMIQLHDGNLAVLVNNHVVKLDTALNVIWQSDELPYLGYSYFREGIFELENDSLVAFYGSMMHILDASGGLVTSVELPDTYYFSLIEQSENGFEAIEITDDSVYYTGLTNSGFVKYNYGFTLDYDPLFSIDFVNKNGISTLVRQNYYGYPLPDSIVMNQFDSLGNMFSTPSTPVDGIVRGVKSVSDGMIVYGYDWPDGTANINFIYKYDDAGSLIWQLATDIKNSDQTADTLCSALETAHHQYVRPISAYSDETNYYYLEYYSAEGDSLLTGPKLFETNEGDDLYHINQFVEAGENLYAFAGWYYSELGVAHGFVALTDSVGYLPAMKISGQVYYDENGNGYHDGDEVVFRDILIATTPGPVYSATDETGSYSAEIFIPDTYELNVILPPYWDISTPANYTESFDPDAVLEDRDFLLSYSTPVTDAYVNLCTSPNLWLVDSSLGIADADIQIKNFGNQTIDDVLLSYHVPSFLTTAYADPSFDESVDTTFTWHIYDLDPYETFYYYVQSYCAFDPDLIGDTIQFTAELTGIVDDITPENNADTITGPITYSFDPNHKTADPAGIGEDGIIDPATEWMEYTIEFQNTGTAPAINITVTDEIDADFELTSLEMIGSNHNYTMTIAEPNLVTWQFNDINLPDTATDLLGSTGFIVYRIRLKEGLPLGTELTNSAAIYFDLNDPIITNTTLNTLEEFEGVENEIILPGIQIYPNPTNDYLIIDFENQSGNRNLMICDITGRKVFGKEINYSEGACQISVSSLPPGFYTLTIIDDNQSGKSTIFIKK